MRIIDLHEDYGVSSGMDNVLSGTEQSNIKKLKKFEDIIVFSSIFPFRRVWNREKIDSGRFTGKGTQAWIPDPSAVYDQAKFYSYLKATKKVDFVRKPTDLTGKSVKFLISFEGLDPVSDASDLYLLYDMGVRCVGLTWNYDNKYAASCYSKKDYGLTGAGEEVLRLCKELGMIVDTAHASRQTTIDVCAVASNVIMSHSNVRKMVDHPRNADEEMLQAIKSRKGIIGMSGISRMVGEKPSIEDLAKHICYVGENFGWDYVALGSDFLGMSAEIDGFRSVDDIPELEGRIKYPDKVFHANAERVIRKAL